MTANGRAVAWKRDPDDLFDFRVEVPQGAALLTVSLDVVAPAERSDLNAASPNILVLDWNTVWLSPKGLDAEAIKVRPQLRIPSGWAHVSALEDSGVRNGAIQFPEVSLAMLIDSPILAGRNLQSVSIPSGSTSKVFVDIAAESPEATRLSERWNSWIQQIVAEAGALYGGYPYPSYHFLFALSDAFGNDGLEHRRSCDIRMSLRAFLEEANRLAYGYLIPHEYTHAWNGKFRIPAGMRTRNFDQTQTTELLWVYEGLTRYLNWVLAARSGLFTPAEARDYVAFLAAQMDHRPGREWRSLQDTAISGQILNDAPTQWQSIRRGVDYYDEALLIWLEADVIIRRTSNSSRSLDDFCRAFLRPAAPDAEQEPYTFDDIVTLLNRVAPFDWKAFLSARLDGTGRRQTPLAGVIASGWKLVYTAVPNVIQSARATVDGTIDERFNTGLLLDTAGSVLDVIRDSPAWKAGLGPYMKVVAKDGKPWESRATGMVFANPTVLLVQNGSASFQVSVAGRADGSHPHLEPNSEADLLSKILEPRRREKR